MRPVPTDPLLLHAYGGSDELLDWPRVRSASMAFGQMAGANADSGASVHIYVHPFADGRRGRGQRAEGSRFRVSWSARVLSVK